MATLKALWTEIVYANVAWYDEYVNTLEADAKLEGISKPKRFERARAEGRRQLLGYSESKLPQNYTQLFHMAGVFRGYRALAKQITDVPGRLTFILIFPINVTEGLTNALYWNDDGTYNDELAAHDFPELAS